MGQQKGLHEGAAAADREILEPFVPFIVSDSGICFEPTKEFFEVRERDIPIAHPLQQVSEKIGWQAGPLNFWHDLRLYSYVSAWRLVSRF